MAKKISTETALQTGQVAEEANGTGNMTVETNRQPAPEVEKTPVSKTLPEGNKKTGDKGTKDTGTEADAGVLEILKKFPAYRALYVDAHGGTYTPDTPAIIRRGAILYNNPYYNEPKTK